MEPELCIIFRGIFYLFIYSFFRFLPNQKSKVELKLYVFTTYTLLYKLIREGEGLAGVPSNPRAQGSHFPRPIILPEDINGGRVLGWNPGAA